VIDGHREVHTGDLRGQAKEVSPDGQIGKRAACELPTKGADKRHTQQRRSESHE